jgi:hypothetical protein
MTCKDVSRCEAHGVQWSQSRAAASCFALLPPLDTQQQSAELTVMSAVEIISCQAEQIGGERPLRLRTYASTTNEHSWRL